MSTAKTIYFAGDLFDHKDLIGNALLASYIDKVSKGRYTCILPQNLEQSSNRAEDIRNQDLKQVKDCELALFNFDGTELDSGTVAEFMFAKFLDKPSVIIRTDFRASGDQEDGDPWNLMCSFYPRTKVITFNGMAEYQNSAKSAEDLAGTIEKMYSNIADRIIKAFDSVSSEQSLFEKNEIDREIIEKWADIFPYSK